MQREVLCTHLKISLRSELSLSECEIDTSRNNVLLDAFYSGPVKRLCPGV